MKGQNNRDITWRTNPNLFHYWTDTYLHLPLAVGHINYSRYCFWALPSIYCVNWYELEMEQVQGPGLKLKPYYISLAHSSSNSNKISVSQIMGKKMWRASKANGQRWQIIRYFVFIRMIIKSELSWPALAQTFHINKRTSNIFMKNFFGQFNHERYHLECKDQRMVVIKLTYDYE